MIGSQIGVCELCAKHAPLLQSHVLPAFVFKWLKQAGHIRYAEAPNRRSQDGVKRNWLCRECEDLFNSFETPFASRIFHPYDLNRSIRIRYGEWMLKFCASVAWRSLLHLKQDQQVTQFNERQVGLVDDALRTWSRYLRGEYKHTGSFELHLLPFDEIAHTGGHKFSPNINRYLTRAIDINAGSSNSMCFTYSKLGPFAVFGFIQSDHSQQWKGTKVSHRGGWFEPGNYTLPRQLMDFLNERASRTSKAMEKISATQQKKIADSLKADPERFLQSGLFRAMQRDIEMFGTEAFAKYDDRSGDDSE
jgi:hypothetical protein